MQNQMHLHNNHFLLHLQQRFHQAIQLSKRLLYTASHYLHFQEQLACLGLLLFGFHLLHERRSSQQGLLLLHPRSKKRRCYTFLLLLHHLQQ